MAYDRRQSQTPKGNLKMQRPQVNKKEYRIVKDKRAPRTEKRKNESTDMTKNPKLKSNPWQQR